MKPILTQENNTGNSVMDPDGERGKTELSVESMQNLIHFMTAVRSLMQSESEVSVSTLLEWVSQGKVSLVSLVEPLTGYDDEQLVFKIKDVLCQKVMSICSTPKRGTKVEEWVQDVSLVKRINSGTLAHLASHTEHWKTRTLNGLVPKRLKSEIIEDEINIYENIFFKRAINEISDFTDCQIKSLSKSIKKTNSSLNWKKHGDQIKDYRRSRILQQLINGYDESQSENDKEIYGKAKKKWESVRKILSSIKSSSFYKSIDVAKVRTIGSHIYQTNILKNDQRYKALYDLWRLIRAEKQKNAEEREGASNDLIKSIDKCYNLYTVICLLYAMQMLDLDIDKNSSIRFDGYDFTVQFTAKDPRFNYTLTDGRDFDGQVLYSLKIEENINEKYDVPDCIAELSLATFKGTSCEMVNGGRQLNVYRRLSQEDQTELRKLIHASESELSRMSRTERDEFNKRREAWDKFIIGITNDKNLRDPQEIELKIYPKCFQYEENEAAVIRLVHKSFSIEPNQNHVYCLPIDITDDKYDSFHEEGMSMIVNYGESFPDTAPENWKDYKKASLPITQEDFTSVPRFIKLLSIHRAKLLMKTEQTAKHCPICYSDNIDKTGENTWQCRNSDCGILFGKTRCIGGCGEYYQWIRPNVDLKEVDQLIDGNPVKRVLEKESIFDRLIITDFEFERNVGGLKMYPICPKCGKRRFR